MVMVRVGFFADGFCGSAARFRVGEIPFLLRGLEANLCFT